MKLSEISPYLIYKFKSESELVKSIQKLSDNFTSSRDEIEDYHNDEKLISAYAAFYLTTNYPKFSHCMDYLSGYENLLRDWEIIDIGVGPGTFMFAIHDYFNGEHKDIFGIETSHLMRKQAVKIRDGLYSSEVMPIVSGANLIPEKKKKRLVLFTHSLNEMGIESGLRYLKDLDPDGVLIIEPGTKSFFKEYLTIRNQLVSQGFNCHYPCPNNSACPLEGKDDWCHQYLKISHDLETGRLAQLAHKNRKWLPLTLGLYLKEEKAEKTIARIIRTFPESKFGYLWDVCHSENKIDLVEVLKRDFKKKDQKRIGSYLSGTEIDFEIVKEMDDKKRIKLKE